MRRLVVSLVLVLFASVTIGVIVGLDDAGRRDLVGRLPGSDPVSAAPSTPAAPSSPAASSTPTTPQPTPSLTATPRATPTPRPTPTPRVSSPRPSTPRPSTARPSKARPSTPATRSPSAPPKKTTALDRARQAAKRPASDYLSGTLTKGRGGVVYLTFDDGPGPYTDDVLAILRRTNSTATFFLLGANLAENPQVATAITRQGSKIGNHTYDHPDLTTLSARQLRWQLRQSPRTKCFRPPFGATNADVRAAIREAGMREVRWDVDTLDWARPGVATLAKTGRLKIIRDGSVILLHDGGGDRRQTVAALPTIIADLEARGFTLRALPGC